MSKTRAEIEAECEEACNQEWTAYVDKLKPHMAKRDAALVALDAAERAAAEKGTP